MRFIRDTRRVVVPATSTLDVAMRRLDRSFRELTIWGIPESPRAVGDAPIVCNFSSQVFFGPTSQGAAAAKVTDDIYLVYDPGDAVRIWPANEPTSSPQQKGTSNEVRGFSITVRLVNSAASPLVIIVEFTAMTIDQG